MRVKVTGAIIGAILVSFMLGYAKFNDLLILAWVAVVLGAIALLLWDRRLREERYQLRADVFGQWVKVVRNVPWPRECQDCGQPAYSWAAVNAHICPAAAPEGPIPAAQPWPGTPARGHGAGAVDSLTDSPPEPIGRGQ